MFQMASKSKGKEQSTGVVHPGFQRVTLQMAWSQAAVPFRLTRGYLSSKASPLFGQC